MKDAGATAPYVDRYVGFLAFRRGPPSTTLNSVSRYVRISYSRYLTTLIDLVWNCYLAFILYFLLLSLLCLCVRGAQFDVWVIFFVLWISCIFWELGLQDADFCFFITDRWFYEQDTSGNLNGEEQGQSNVKVFCRMCNRVENEGSEKAKKMLSCKSCSKKYHRSCLKSWSNNRGEKVYFSIYTIMF